MKIVKYLWIIGMAVFITTAIFSVGYHHFDEHYQILDFAGSKLDYTNAENLPWEYKAQIRPAFQVAIAYGIIKTISTAGIVSHFDQATVLRILMGLFSLIVIYFFIKSLIPRIKPKYQPWFIFLSLFLFFIPYLSVRFSSESLGGILFISGLVLVIKKYYTKKDLDSWRQLADGGNDILIGIILGLSFITRFQNAFLIIGLGLWLIIIKRIKLNNILKIILGSLLSIGLGVLIDYWFYGQWTLTAYNYFVTNIIDNTASLWGIYPWWQYFQFLTDWSWASILGYLLIGFSLLFFIKNYKNVITWSILPFLIIHFIIPHKELRFLFPLAWLMPFIIIEGLQFVFSKIPNRAIEVLLFIILMPVLIINIFILGVRMLTPADGGILIYKYIYNNYSPNNTTVYYLKEHLDFVGRQGYLSIYFYDPDHFINNKIEAKNIADLRPKSNENILIISKNINNLSQLPLKKVYTILPDLITKKYDIKNRMQIKNSDWVVYKVVN